MYITGIHRMQFIQRLGDYTDIKPLSYDQYLIEGKVLPTLRVAVVEQLPRLFTDAKMQDQLVVQASTGNFEREQPKVEYLFID